MRGRRVPARAHFQAHAQVRRCILKLLLNLHACWDATRMDDFSVDDHTGRRENTVTRDFLRVH